jgi:hypothetical protein
MACAFNFRATPGQRPSHYRSLGQASRRPRILAQNPSHQAEGLAYGLDIIGRSSIQRFGDHDLEALTPEA